MSALEVEQLDTLADRLAMTRSAAIRLALKELARKLKSS
jgi:predicted transcriptional regulator